MLKRSAAIAYDCQEQNQKQVEKTIDPLRSSFYYSDIAMFNFVRKVVAGPKNTTTYEGAELDLSYINDRVIAMAFPASDIIEKTYRNPIEDVVSYFKTNHHQQFLIVNVSSRLYNYSAFDGRVKDFKWPDHQAPPLTTLVQIAYQMYRFLRDGDQSVVAVHCNHGKGRTGTAIISFLLLIGYFSSAAQCLKYYNSKRFNKDTYGVDQPCQLRYLGYIERLLASPKISPKLVCYRLKSISHKGLSCEHYVRIHKTRNQSQILNRVEFGLKLEEPNLLIADIFIEIFQISWKGEKRIARINCNLYFCDPQNMQLTFSGKDIKLSDNHPSDFEITLHLQYFCLCHLPMYEETVCKCKTERVIEQKHWTEMLAQVKECKKISNKKMLALLQRRAQQRQSRDDTYEYAETRDKPKFRSFSNRKFKSAHQEKLQSLVEQTIQQRLFKQENAENTYTSCVDAPKTRELSEEVQYYQDEPTIKISKIEKTTL